MISTQRTLNSSLPQDTPKIFSRRYEFGTLHWSYSVCSNIFAQAWLELTAYNLTSLFDLFSPAWLHERWDICGRQGWASDHRELIQPERCMWVALQLVTDSAVAAADHSLPTQLQAGAAQDRSRSERWPPAQTVWTGQQAEGDCTAGATAEVQWCYIIFCLCCLRKTVIMLQHILKFSTVSLLSQPTDLIVVRVCSTDGKFWF